MKLVTSYGDARENALYSFQDVRSIPVVFHGLEVVPSPERSRTPLGCPLAVKRALSEQRVFVAGEAELVYGRWVIWEYKLSHTNVDIVR
jgi:hypothetical protein